MIAAPISSTNTVDDIVHSLVQEIDNELIQNMTDKQENDNETVEGFPLVGEELNTFQLPLHEIGEDTMEMIVDYNTKVNMNKMESKIVKDSVDFPKEVQSEHSNENGSDLHSISSSSENSTSKTSAEENTLQPHEQQKALSIQNNSFPTNNLPDNSDIDMSDISFIPVKEQETYKMVDGMEGKQQQERDSSVETSKLLGIGIVNLPPLPEEKPMFRNASLSKILDDTSIDSLDDSDASMTGIKPKDYLSVWHMQETISPTVSHNSIFSGQTNSTMVSSPSLTPSNTLFKFKPRVVSRSSVYYPSSGTSSNTSSRHASGVSPAFSANTFESCYSDLRSNNTQEVANPINLNDAKRVNSERIRLINFDNQVANPSSVRSANLNNSFNDRSYDNTGNKSKYDISSSINNNATYKLSDRSYRNINKDKLGPLGISDTFSSDFNDILKALEDIDNDINDIVVIDDEEEESNERDVTVNSPQKTKYGDYKTLNNNEDVNVTPKKAVTPQSSHIRSPFKVISPYKAQSVAQSPNRSIQSEGIDEEFANSSDDGETMTNVKIITEEIDSDIGADIESDTSSLAVIEAPVQLIDDGTLYLNIKKLNKFKIEGAKYRKAQFCIEMKLGSETSTLTSWQPINNDNCIPIDKSMAFVIDDDFKSKTSKIELLVKCKYERITSQAVEVTKKVAVGKKFPFGKTKYVYEKTFIEKPVEKDAWDNIVGPEGEYGLSILEVNKALLKESKFGDVTKTIDIENKWTKGYLSYSVGEIEFDATFIARSLDEEIIPEDIFIAKNIVDKYNRQRAIQMEGYLLQEGGDIKHGQLQRRYFTLHGTELIGKHEISGNPVIDINLLNASRILSSFNSQETRENTGNSRNFSNMTDVLLMGGSIVICFQDGETITLTVESSEGEALEWYNSLSEVAALNISHQPWVKNMSSSQLYT